MKDLQKDRNTVSVVSQHTQQTRHRLVTNEHDQNDTHRQTDSQTSKSIKYFNQDWLVRELRSSSRIERTQPRSQRTYKLQAEILNLALAVDTAGIALKIGTVPE